jgi:hypothetical protein
MRVSEPKVFIDCEFQFANGQSLFVTAEPARGDLLAQDAERVKLTLKPDDTTHDEVIVHRATLAYERYTKREVPAESETRPTLVS